MAISQDAIIGLHRQSVPPPPYVVDISSLGMNSISQDVEMSPLVYTVWKACHSYKKLQKKQILDTDIREAVDRIADYISVRFYCVSLGNKFHVTPLSNGCRRISIIPWLYLFIQLSDPSLRVVGSLLVGVARLYGRRIAYLEMDCREVYNRIRQSVGLFVRRRIFAALSIVFDFSDFFHGTVCS